MIDTQAIYDQVQQEFDCAHTHTRLRVKTASNGTRRFHVQCLRCGESTRPVRRDELSPREIQTAGTFDDALKDSWQKRKWDRHTQLTAEAKANEQADWDAWYEAYLRSPTWRANRDAVMRRAKGVCEASLDPARTTASSG